MALGAVGLARIKSDYKKYQEALEFYFIAKDYFTELKMFDYVSSVYQNMSETYSDLNQFAEAEKYNNDAIKGFEKSNNLYGLSTAYGTRSMLLQRRGNKVGATDFALKSYSITALIANLPEMAAKANLLYNLYSL